MKKIQLAALAAFLLFATALQGPTLAGSISVIGSDNSNDTYAGDANWLSVPAGTFVVQNFFGYATSNQYITTPNNVFGVLTGGVHKIPSTLDYYTDTTRLSYYANFGGVPLIFEGAAKYEKANTVNVGNLGTPVGGLGPQTMHNGWANPELGFTVGLMSDPRMERYLAFSNYFYLSSSFDNFKQFNVNPPHQFTYVPQLAYSEGLAKFGLKNWWLDVIGNTSIHSHGSSALALAPGVQFNTLNQSDSYNVKSFLRYDYMPLGHVAVGIEKSWGGDSVASGGILQLIFGQPISFGTDKYTKGHLQLAAPLPYDLQLAADLTHDFQRDGGFKENLGIQLRLTKFFVPMGAAPAPEFPVKGRMADMPLSQPTYQAASQPSHQTAPQPSRLQAIENENAQLKKEIAALREQAQLRKEYSALKAGLENKKQQTPVATLDTDSKQ